MSSFNSKIHNMHFRPENVLGWFKNKYFESERDFILSFTYKMDLLLKGLRYAKYLPLHA
jgi:hypothetical protein